MFVQFVNRLCTENRVQYSYRQNTINKKKRELYIIGTIELTSKIRKLEEL